jgi:cytosine/adenosine deaminase-related metal-dependent hydrolase
VANLVYAARGSDVVAVFVNGRLLVRGGQPVDLDSEGILAHATQAARRLADVRA